MLERMTQLVTQHEEGQYLRAHSSMCHRNKGIDGLRRKGSACSATLLPSNPR